MLALVAALALSTAPLETPEEEAAAVIDALHAAASSADGAACQRVGHPQTCRLAFPEP